MTVAPDIDPLSLVLAPPKDETPEAREARLLKEREAKKRSDMIDLELKRDQQDKKSKPVKILLLGQSESGKSTTLKNFQLINSPKAFRSERSSWRAVVHLNVVRSVRLILHALGEAEASSASSVPPGPDEPVYPEISSELRTLKMRLSPLQQVEEALLAKLTPGAAFKDRLYAQVDVDEPLTNGPESTRGGNPAAEVAVQSGAPWKGAFNRLIANARGSVDGPEVEAQDSREARQLLQACSEDVIRLWSDPTVKEVLKVHRLRLEDMAGFFLDSIERVTDLSYEPTDDDILKARLKTLGVSEHHFSLKAGNMIPQKWVVFDVGGARSLRAAWVPYFDDMNAIIFLAPLSCFDQVLAEDETVNRLEDSILLWKAVVSNPLLKDTSLILFLNKIDILKAKLASGQKFNEFVVSYGDKPNDFENTSQYMKKKFTMIAKQHSAEPRGFYTYFTSVTDAQSTADILGSVRDIIVRSNLTRSQLV
ncbi:guanine nucleotide binding protein, alpha subunit [Roridomyces roridus]|uniref:Guanine nucleotide binding protein, alpha subunit n=1 Tax=Roridomyces roridus TaxID=1738132 RepID=A0AAD7FX10_9AGAR|nr:guanine nucleotide binding protein, alpha subunit [Roridomyces roridus]